MLKACTLGLGPGAFSTGAFANTKGDWIAKSNEASQRTIVESWTKNDVGDAGYGVVDSLSCR